MKDTIKSFYTWATADKGTVATPVLVRIAALFAVNTGLMVCGLSAIAYAVYGICAACGIQ